MPGITSTSIAPPYKASEMFVLGQTEEIQMLLDDQLMKIQAMNASPYVKPFQERAKDWEKTLSNLQVCLLQLHAAISSPLPRFVQYLI